MHMCYSGTIERSDPSDTVHSGVAVCHNAVLSYQGNHCLPQSPIVIYDAPINGDSQCWNIGNVFHTNIAFINDSNPSQGMEILYGTTHCCPQNGLASPGNVGSLRVVVTLLPGDCDKTQEVWSIAEMDYPKPSLTNCSAATSETFSAHVMTTRLCPQHIFWRLSLNNSELNCTTSGEIVSCKVIPRLAINNSIDTSLCSRFNVNLNYKDSVVEVRALSNLTTGTSKPCTFHVSKDNNLHSISVTDIDGTPVGKLYNISAKAADDSVKTNLIIGLSVSGGMVGIIVASLVLFAYRRKKSGDEEKGQLLHQPPGRAQGSAHSKKSGTTDGKVQKSDS